MEEERIKEMALQLANEQSSLDSKVQQSIEDNYDKQLATLKDNKALNELTNQITERNIKVKLGKDMFNVMSEEQRLELSAYFLDCEKQKLDYRKKKEKALITEEVRAEIKEKKVEILKKRYGYMYGKDEEFIPSKTYNKIREIANWYNGTSDTFKKIVKGTFKLALYGTIIYLAIKYGYEGLLWLSNNVNINAQ